MATYQWVSGAVPKDLPIRQVYGIAFDDKGRILLRIENGKYQLTGGKPEPYDATMEDTLKREFMEEANITLKNIHMLGYQYVEEDSCAYAQVRMIAQIDEIMEQRPDPDNGEIYRRLLTSPENVKKYLNWGEVGNAQIDDAVALAKTCYLPEHLKEEFLDPK